MNATRGSFVVFIRCFAAALLVAARSEAVGEAVLALRASAFEEVVRRYQRRVYGVALRIVRTHDVADDVAQEAFVRAWRSLDRFELGRPFGPWVCRIAANLALNHVRSPRAREEGLPEGHAEVAGGAEAGGAGGAAFAPRGRL